MKLNRFGCLGLVALALGAFIVLTFESPLFTGFWNIIWLIVALYVFGLMLLANKKLLYGVLAGVALAIVAFIFWR